MDNKITLIIAILTVFLTACGPVKHDPIVVSTPVPPTVAISPTPAPIRVYVTGCVRQPGVYELAPHSVVDAAVTAAGGPTGDADLDHVNLAREPQHEEQITIPCLPVPSPTSAISTTVVTEIAAGELLSVTTTCNGLNINIATPSDFETLPGIGPSKAAAIAAYRDENGPFGTVENLVDVPGIGPATLDNLRPHICTR
jgi:competence protein ComEA